MVSLITRRRPDQTAEHPRSRGDIAAPSPAADETLPEPQGGAPDAAPASDAVAPASAAGSSALELVERAQAGDHEAFAQLYRQRLGIVTRHLTAILRDADRADDAAAETFLVAWRQLSTLRRPDRFDAWMFRIARNLAMNELKRQRALPLTDVFEPPDENRLNSPTAVLEGRMDAQAVGDAMQKLSEDQRAVLVMRFVHELPHARIATMTGKSEEAVRALQYRALNRLRQLMRSEFQTDAG